MNFPRIRVLSGILVALAAVLIYVATAPNTATVPISSGTPIPHIKHTPMASVYPSPSRDRSSIGNIENPRTVPQATVAPPRAGRPKVLGYQPAPYISNPSHMNTNSHRSGTRPKIAQQITVVPKPIITPKSTAKPRAKHRPKTNMAKSVNAMIDQFDLSPDTINQGKTATLCAGTEPETTGSVSGIGTLRRGIISCFHVSPTKTTTYRLTVSGRSTTTIRYRTLTVQQRHSAIRHTKPSPAPSPLSTSLTSP